MKIDIVVFTLACALGVSGETFTWTGAVDGRWTNAANWQVGGAVATRCPGICSNEIFDVNGMTNAGWNLSVHTTDLASFGADGNAAANIDFSGLYCVSAIVFTAGCPVYALGRDETDVIPPQTFTKSKDWTVTGLFAVESGARAPTLVGGFSCGTVSSLMNAGSDRGCLVIRNDSTDELVFKTIGHSHPIEKSASAHKGVWCTAAHLYMRFAGTGDFRFDGPVRGMQKYGGSDMLQTMWFFFSTSGRVVFSAPQFGRGRTGTTYDAAENKGLLSMMLDGTPFVEIRKGCRVSFSDWNNPQLYFYQNGEIGGDGTLQLAAMTGKGLRGNYGQNCVAGGKRGRISCVLDIYDTYNACSPDEICLRFCSGDWDVGGTFEFTGPTNCLSGPVWFGNSKINYRALSIPGFGTGTTAFFDNNGSFDYGGAGQETFSRTCTFVAKDATATIRNTGTGSLALTSAFVVTNGSTVTLSPETAPIVFTGSVRTCDGCSFTAPLVKAGSNTLVLAAAADLTAVSSLRLTAGTLDLTDYVAGTSATLAMPVTFDTGASTLYVPDGKTVTLASLGRTSGTSTGTLDIRCNTGRVKMADATSATAAPAGVTVNGTPSAFDDDGTLLTAPPACDAAIAARGDTVPNDASKIVAITTDGTGGNDTLAADATAVKSLIHSASADATIEIGANRTFAAGFLELFGLAGNLAIGAADDAGTVAGAEGSLVLASRNPYATLALNAAVAAGTEIRTDGNTAGPILLAGGTAGEITVRQTDGTLTLTGEKTIRINGGEIGTLSTSALAATLVVDGAKEVILGEEPLHVGGVGKRPNGIASTGRMIVTNACIRNASVEQKSYAYGTTNDAICVGLFGDARLEIQAGATITNRLCIGDVYRWESNNWAQKSHGAVLQTGGEMVVLGADDSPNNGSFIGSGTGMGYYELRGGRLVWMGCLSVSTWSTGGGSFAQFGGYALFTNAYGSAKLATIGPNAEANGGCGVMRFAGGTADVRANIILAGGATNSGRSLLTVEDEADVDAGGNMVKLCATHSSHNNRSYFRQADVVITGGGALRAAGFYTGYNASCPDYPQYYSVGFNGGTFRTGAEKRDIANALRNSNSQTMTNFVIYAGGATIDTEGKSGNYSTGSFRGAWGKGVASVPLAQKSYAGLVASPYVIIYGDGVGAAAVADFDSSTGTLTGIRVITPGAGYTWAKASVYRDTAYKIDDDDIVCKLADNDTTGGFTKRGAGDLTLKATNTWSGATRLEGGVLRLGVSQALPENATVVYAGGTLEATAAASPAAFTAELPSASVADRKSVKLITYTDAVPAVLPEIALEGIPAGEIALWSVALRGKTLSATCATGTVLYFR